MSVVSKVPKIGDMLLVIQFFWYNQVPKGIFRSTRPTVFFNIIATDEGKFIPSIHPLVVIYSNSSLLNYDLVTDVLTNFYSTLLQISACSV